MCAFREIVNSFCELVEDSTFFDNLSSRLDQLQPEEKKYAELIIYTINNDVRILRFLLDRWKTECGSIDKQISEKFVEWIFDHVTNFDENREHFKLYINEIKDEYTLRDGIKAINLNLAEGEYQEDDISKAKELRSMLFERLLEIEPSSSLYELYQIGTGAEFEDPDDEADDGADEE
jgi:hypothetical protein